MKVAELDMTNSSYQCPSGFRERTFSGIRTCGINSDSPSCSSVTFSSAALEYSKVCVWENYRISDWIHRRFYKQSKHKRKLLVSLQYIWIFTEANIFSTGICPCTSNQPNSATPPPAFVGQDYFCDIGIGGQGKSQPACSMATCTLCGMVSTGQQ